MQGFVQEVGKEVYRPALALSSVVPTLGKGLHAGIMCRSISGNLIEKFGKEKKITFTNLSSYQSLIGLNQIAFDSFSLGK